MITPCCRCGRPFIAALASHAGDRPYCRPCRAELSGCPGCGCPRPTPAGSPRAPGLCPPCLSARCRTPPDLVRDAGPPPAPTDAPPGSEAKILALQARASAGFDLFRSDDAGGG